MHVCVVGGAGFVGSHLVDRLLAEGDTVDVVDDLSSGSLANLSAARAVSSGALKFHHLDVRSGEFTELVARRPPAVIYHLTVLPAGRRSRGDIEAALGSTLQVLETAARVGAPKVVATLPASALYGPVPSRDLPIKEGRTGEPSTVEGVAANAVIELLNLYRTSRNIEFTALATASVYGPRQRHDGGVIAAMLRAYEDGAAPVIEGDGRQTRDFVYIDDVADALVRAAGRGSGLVVNIGTGVQTPIREVFDRLSVGRDDPPIVTSRRSGEPGKVALSVVRARIHLGWEPWTAVETGLDGLTRAPEQS
jgi:UDP-glucose 4-epimerase